GGATAQQAPSLKPTTAVPAAASTQATPITPDAGADRLTKADADAWLDGFMPYALRNGDVAGAVVVIVKDGQILTQRGFGYAGVEDRAKNISFFNAKFAPSLSDYVKTSLPARIFDPGTTPAYSNYATTLAAYIVQRVSKTPFDTYVEQHVFTPLGMTRSTFRQ